MDGWCRRATAPARTYSSGASPTSPFNISSTTQRHEQPARLRPRRHRRLLPHLAWDRVLGGAPREERERGLLPGEPGRGLVRRRRQPVRVEYRERASGWARRHRCGERARGGALRVARMPHPPAPWLAVRAVLPAHRRGNDVRGPRSPVLTRLAPLLSICV